MTGYKKKLIKRKILHHYSKIRIDILVKEIKFQF